MERDKLRKVINLERYIFIKTIIKKRDSYGNISEQDIFDKLNKYTLLKKALHKIIPDFKGGANVMEIIAKINLTLEKN